jgi:hypothetical protein
MLCIGGLGLGYIVLWDEPRPSDQTDLKRRSRCDVEMCCNVLREGEGCWPLDQAGWPEGGRAASSGVLSVPVSVPCLLMSSGVF